MRTLKEQRQFKRGLAIQKRAIKGLGIVSDAMRHATPEAVIVLADAWLALLADITAAEHRAATRTRAHAL